MLRFILVFFLGILISSCSAAFKERIEDGYQFGDLSSAQIENLEIYCTSTDPQVRAAARSALDHVIGVVVPLNPCGLWEALEPVFGDSEIPSPGIQPGFRSGSGDLAPRSVDDG
jgi:hypothetical protein